MEHDVLKISEENRNLSIPAFICKLLSYVIPRNQSEKEKATFTFSVLNIQSVIRSVMSLLKMRCLTDNQRFER